MGLATDWIARNVSRFRSTDAAAPATKSEGEAAKGPAPRGTAQRLQATLRRGQEVLSPRELRKLMEDLQAARSEEHTSELQSQSNLVCRLLLEKKKIQ